MKRLLIGLLCMICLTGCSTTKYEEVELTEDNIDDYLEVVANRSKGSYGVDYRVKIKSVDSSYKFEDVSFDLELIDCYYYDGYFGFETTNNIYVEEYDIELRRDGSYSFDSYSSTDEKIKRLCSVDVWDLYDNVSGKVLIPY